MSRSATPGGENLANLSREELLERLRTARRENRCLEKQIVGKDADIDKLRSRSVEAQAASEVEEERLSNTLLRHVDSLRKSNSEVAESIKAHEHRNRAVLADLAQVRKSKIELENRIEAEQERMLNQLQRQLLALAAEKTRLEKQLQTGREEVLASLHTEVERLRLATERSESSAPNPDRGQPTASAESHESPSRQQRARGSSTVLNLEEQLASLLSETRAAQAECEQADQRCGQLSDELQHLQQESLIAKLRMAKLREELQRAHSELESEQVSASDTPLPSSDATPSMSVMPTVPGSSSVHLGAWPSSARRPSHHRTHSGSSVESWSSASVVSSAAPNVALARDAGRDMVRQHTARVLSSAPAHPSPRRPDRAASASRSGRNSAAPQPMPTSPAHGPASASHAP